MSAECLTRTIFATSYVEEVAIKALFAYLPTPFGSVAFCLNSIIQAVKG